MKIRITVNQPACTHRVLKLKGIDLRRSIERYACMDCGEPWAGVERGGSLFSDLDAIDEVGGLSEASRRQVPVFLIVKHQPFSHGLREL